MSRLIPENKQFNSSATLKPKVLGISKSTPFLESAKGDAAQLHASGGSKVQKLRAIVPSQKDDLHDHHHPNMIMSHTMPTLPPPISNADETRSFPINLNQSSSSPNLLETHTIKDENLNDSKRTLSNDGSIDSPLKAIATSESNMTFHKHSFISSLDLSQKQLNDLFKIPQTFYYLSVKKADGKLATVSVYDLEMIPLEQVDKNFYFTLSKEGVTQFRNKVSTFTSLSQWEREYRLYNRIASINFFKVYKRWKVGYYQLCHIFFLSFFDIIFIIYLFNRSFRLSLFGAKAYRQIR